jgi:membrane protein
VARNAGKGLLQHNAMGLAAELAYFTFLSIFPFLICLVALSHILPTPSTVGEVQTLVARVLPRAVVDSMVGQMIQLSRANNVLIIALGLMGALWSGSSALHSLMSAVNRAYDANDRRRWREVRVAALWLTISSAAVITFVIGLATVMPRLAAKATDPRSPLWVIFGGAARWVVVWFAIAGVAALVYRVSLDVDDRPRARLAPGAAVAASIWTIATFFLHLYMSHVGNYGLTYGALGGAMFVLLWFYFTNLSVLVGAEVNGELSNRPSRRPARAA